MYNDFFGLSEKPFSLEPNARFIVLTEDHREALATLVFAVEQQEGWAALVGAPGVGKTTLIIALLQELSDRVVPAVITNPHLEPLDFMNMVALELGLKGPFSSKGHFLVAFKQLVQQCRAAGKILLLVVDEAQAMAFEMLEEMRLLSNIDDSSPKVLNFLLSGQMELLSVLSRDEAVALRQRLRHFYTLRPLSVDETRTYIRHRLRVAQGSPDTFTDRAAFLVYQLTNGVPRMVNMLCDEALIVAFTRGRSKVDLEDIKEAARDLPMLLIAKQQARQAQPAAGPATPPDQTPKQPPLQEQAQIPAQPKPQPVVTSPPPTAQPSKVQPTAQANAEPQPKQQAEVPTKPIPPSESVPISRPPETEKQQAQAPPPHAKPKPKMPARPASTPRRGEKIKSKAKKSGKAPLAKEQGLKRQGMASRFLNSMSKGSKGGFVRRLLLLVILLALVAGGYWLFKSGNAVKLGRFIAPYIGLGNEVELFTPSDQLPTGRIAKTVFIPEDWGPTITIKEKEDDHG